MYRYCKIEHKVSNKNVCLVSKIFVLTLTFEHMEIVHLNNFTTLLRVRDKYESNFFKREST